MSRKASNTTPMAVSLSQSSASATRARPERVSSISWYFHASPGDRRPTQRTAPYGRSRVGDVRQPTAG